MSQKDFFFACIFVKTKMAVVSWIVFQLMTKTHQKKTNIPFSQARNTGNEVATFHPRQNAALKNLSQLWTTMLFKLPQKQSKIFNKTDYYNSFFFCSNIISHNEGGWMILIFCCYMRHFFIFDYKQLLINNRLLFKKYHYVKLIVIHLIVDEIFSVGCFPYNLSEQKRSIGMWNWFPKFCCCCNFQCWYLSTVLKELAAIFWFSYSWRQSKVVIISSWFGWMNFQAVQPGQISPYDYIWKLNFVPARWDSFPHSTCLDLCAFSLNFSL